MRGGPRANSVTVPDVLDSLRAPERDVTPLYASIATDALT